MTQRLPPFPTSARPAWPGSLSSFLCFPFFTTFDAATFCSMATRSRTSILRGACSIPQTPGLLQLGTVWLPLPHLLMIPFIWSNAMWQNGTGGSIPSMIAYVFGVMGIFRLARGMLEADLSKRAQEAGAKPAAGVGAWAAAFAYGANPNLIYMQATAMTESLYLALFIWAVVYFAEFLPRCLR